MVLCPRATGALVNFLCRYESVQDYIDTFLRLVSLEAGELRKRGTMKNISVRWSVKNGRNYANFKIPSEYQGIFCSFLFFLLINVSHGADLRILLISDLGIRITPGDVLTIGCTFDSEEASRECVVTAVPDGEYCFSSSLGFF